MITCHIICVIIMMSADRFHGITCATSVWPWWLCLTQACRIWGLRGRWSGCLHVLWSYCIRWSAACCLLWPTCVLYIIMADALITQHDDVCYICYTVVSVVSWFTLDCVSLFMHDITNTTQFKPYHYHWTVLYIDSILTSAGTKMLQRRSRSIRDEHRL